jgi:hypothetical protein
MPTTRPRHQVTETDELRVALDEAARRWPELSRAQLLIRLALDGAQAQQDRTQARLEALDRFSGIATGCYKDGYLAELRADWPA